MTDALASRTDPRDPRPAMDVPTPRDAARASGDDGHGAGLLAALVGVSVAVHLAIVGLAGAERARASHRARPPSVVTMEIAPPPSAPPVAAPRPPATAAARRGPTRTVSVAAPPQAAPRAVEAPADFSGVTLTNDGPGPGWSSATGSGQAMTGPIGGPQSAASGAAHSATDAAVIPLSSLSRPPSPPDLNATLEAHYPPEARRQGLAGRAVLRAHITAEGRARDLVLLTQSAEGFGEACRAALRDAVWTPPLDRDGRAVATLVTYTCQFEVR